MSHWTEKWSLARIVAFLGADHVEWIKRQPSPAITCQTRANGAWMANDGDTFAAYRALATILNPTPATETRP